MWGNGNSHNLVMSVQWCDHTAQQLWMIGVQSTHLFVHLLKVFCRQSLYTTPRHL